MDWMGQKASTEGSVDVDVSAGRKRNAASHVSVDRRA
jgi:hypothetical protein